MNRLAIVIHLITCQYELFHPFVIKSYTWMLSGNIAGNQFLLMVPWIKSHNHIGDFAKLYAH